MSVKIYPYLAKPADLAAGKGADSGQNSGAADATDFKKILAGADRSVKAMAVDALIAQSETGSVDVATVQKLFGFSPAPNPIVVKSGSSAAASGSGTANSAGASGRTDGTESGAAADRTDGTGSGAAADKTDGTGSGAAAGKTDSAADKADGGSSQGGCTPKMDQYFAEAAALYGVDMSLLKAIARAESNYNPSATSASGAMGVMQLMPSVASGLGIGNAYDAHDNIMGGAKLIAEYIERYNGDVSLALAAYNAGPGNVDKYNGVPPFEETQKYVKKVMDYYLSA